MSKPRKNPMGTVREKAREAARSRKPVSACPYDVPSTAKTIWLTTFQREQQLEIVLP